jgi:NDP-sugar pyrophosphorylase family protein
MKVVIIAGGKGTRISSIANEIPKSMIKVEERPVIEYQVELAKRYGFNEFIFIIGHLGEQIETYFGDGSKWGVSIQYFKEKRSIELRVL